MTRVITSLKTWQSLRNTFSHDQIVGFVPTMGNLHRGHESLLQQARTDNAISVLSIFVNPTQFNDPNDLANYPRTFDRDLQIAKSQKVDYVLLPNNDDLYPDDYRYQVNETKESLILEGQSRPGHFTGMLTIVLKLLNLVKPHRVYFGEKDFQQLELVKGMARALFLDVEIIACPTIREHSGLAMSSRNGRLSETERHLADCFAKALKEFTNQENFIAQLDKHGIVVDYIETWKNRLLAAVQIGKIRLIDNVKIC
ncbi:MAG: pantoate--beta-alanine ligase [Candidatus Berkiella sp.]